MSNALTSKLIAFSLLPLLLIAMPRPAPVCAEAARAKTAMVATVHPLATQAGLDALARGGNAVDAAVAAALMLGVVDNHNSGLGGGCFILIRRADGGLAAIDGRETAPAAASRDMYVREGKVQPRLSLDGPLAVGVPGALAAYQMALTHHGTQSLSDLLQPAANRAEEGFALDRVYAQHLVDVKDVLAQFPDSAKILLKPNGQPYREGEILKQPDLATTYRQIADHGTDWFYRGAFAKNVGDWMAAHGGILTAQDFAHYQARRREPIVSTYRDLTLLGFPPPSSGGVHVAQILNILESFDLKSLFREDPARARHLMVEAMKRAFADRAHWLGDADFSQVPSGLIDKAYARKLASQIDIAKATAVKQHGLPPGWENQFFGKHTTHIAAADAAGNWVAITATINTSFGSKVIVPGTGVVLNNEMDDFSSQPGMPNVFGLVGAENNAIAPGKRPLSSMSPTIVLRGDQPILTLGAAGGPKIITQVVLAIVRYCDRGMSLCDSIAAPRFHHQWLPNKVLVERTLPASTRDALKKLGHIVETMSSAGATQAIAWEGCERGFVGVPDPRIPGKAAGLAGDRAKLD